MKYLGLDLGTKTLGIAISVSGIIASPLKTIHFKEHSELIPIIKELITDNGITEIALGLPKNMDNSLGFASQRSIEFKEYLEKNIDVPITLVDERLSTVEANMYLLNENMSRQKRKKVIDAVAASVILNTFIRMKRNIKNED